MFLRFFILLLPLLVACAAQKQPDHSAAYQIQKLTKDPLNEEGTKMLLEESFKNWAYGDGLGDSAVKLGASVVFPPFAFVWLGNTILELTGHKKLVPQNVLPKETGEKWDNFYTRVTSVPGKVAASINQENFRDDKVAEAKIKQVFRLHENPVDFSDV